MKKIDQKTIDAIQLLLAEGHTQTEIAELTGLSRKTVQRIKKELADADDQSTELQSPNSISVFKYTVKAQKLQELMEKEKEFEDTEEGWVYHVSKQKLSALNRTRSLWWVGIVYPESAPEGWETRLAALGCQIAISPLHDKDRWEHDDPSGGGRYRKGDLKKAHWHIIIKFEVQVSFKEVQEWVRDITKGPYLQKCNSLKGSYEYFTHLNHPKRYQYERDEIQRYNGFVLEPNKQERKILQAEIVEVITNEEFETMTELSQYYLREVEYINIIGLRSFYFNQLLTDNWRKHHPEGRTQKVELVEGHRHGSKI